MLLIDVSEIIVLADVSDSIDVSIIANDGDGEGLSLGLSDGLSDADGNTPNIPQKSVCSINTSGGDGLGETLGDSEGLSETLSDGLSEGLSEGLSDADGLKLGDSDGDSLADGLRLGDSHGVSDGLSHDVKEGHKVAE